MIVSATTVVDKFQWWIDLYILLLRFPLFSFLLQPEDSHPLATLNTTIDSVAPAVAISSKRLPFVCFDACKIQIALTGRRSVASIPYRRSLGIRPFSTRRLFPSQRSRHLQSMRCMLRELVFSNTAALVTLSYRVITMIRRKQHIWKLSRRFSCRAYVVEDSLPYSRVLRTHA